MKNPPKHVILIGFDGMSANSLKNGVAMPNYRSMMKRGSHTETFARLCCLRKSVISEFLKHYFTF
jgi:predicted AlkP superfamily pyrophosphatase or phosphodiesterase